MKTGESIFIFGNEPNPESRMLEKYTHPLSPKVQVRFVKHPVNGNIYFNMKDFLDPFGNKKYNKVISRIVPRRLRKLDKVWMSVLAWNEIKNGIDEGKEKDVITGWKERLLF